MTTQLLKERVIDKKSVIADFGEDKASVDKVVMELFLYFCKLAQNSADEKLSAIKRKFSQEVFSGVANIKICLRQGENGLPEI